MRKIRFLIMMAAMLLSCGIANAQGSEATDGQTTTLKGDLNEDGRVNAADVTVLVGIIMNTDYFLLGTDTEMPNRSNYTTLGGVVTTYKSIDDVLKAAPKVSLKADQRGTLLCPESWDVKDLVLQNEGNGTSYALNAADTDISGYNLFQTEKVADEAEYVLKTKAAADAYKISITDYFYLGTVEPTKDNYNTLDGVVTTYRSIEDALKAAPTLVIEDNRQGFLLCPTDWVANGLVLQKESNGAFYELISIATPEPLETDISGYTLFKTEEIGDGGTFILKTKAAAEEYKSGLNPQNQYFWLGNTYPTKNNFPKINGTEVDGIFTNCTSLGDAMDKASRDYSAGEYAVVLYPYSWGTVEDMVLDDQLVFLDSANKKYYATKKKTASDFPDYLYYESTEKIGANTTIKLSTKKNAEDAGATLYEKVTPVNPEPGPVNPEPEPGPVVVPTQAEYVGGNGITFVIVNKCGYEARFTGKVILNVSKNPNNWGDAPQVYANFHGPQSGTSWDRNDIIIPAGQSWTSNPITSIDPVLPQYYGGVNFTDGSWYFMNSDNGQYVHSIYLYTRMYSRSRGETGGSNHMYTAVPLKNTKLQRGYKYYLELNWKNPEASLAPDTSGSKYIILEKNKTGL